MGIAARSDDQLSGEGRQALEAAHRRLRETVAFYEQFTGQGLPPDQLAPVHDRGQMAQAQADVETAENELWRLREDLLGWSRPTGTPGATLVADWFSDEDAVYDDITPASGQ